MSKQGQQCIEYQPPDSRLVRELAESLSIDEGLLPTSPESGMEVVRGLAEFLKLAGSIQAKHLNRTADAAG